MDATECNACSWKKGELVPCNFDHCNNDGTECGNKTEDGVVLDNCALQITEEVDATTCVDCPNGTFRNGNMERCTMKTSQEACARKRNRRNDYHFFKANSDSHRDNLCQTCPESMVMDMDTEKCTSCPVNQHRPKDKGGCSACPAGSTRIPFLVTDQMGGCPGEKGMFEEMDEGFCQTYATDGGLIQHFPPPIQRLQVVTTIRTKRVRVRSKRYGKAHLHRRIPVPGHTKQVRDPPPAT